MSKHVIIFETVFALHENHTPRSAVKLVQNNLEPLTLEEGAGNIVETVITAGVGDSDWVFTPTDNSEEVVGDYCVMVETSMLTPDIDGLEKINSYVETEWVLASPPTIDEELGYIFTDDIKVWNSDGELIFLKKV